LAKGCLLVAAPGLADPNFQRTVIYLLGHDDSGSIGVVLNRPSETHVGEVVPDWMPLAAEPPFIFVGGPVQTNGALCVARVAPGVEIPQARANDGVRDGVDGVAVGDDRDDAATVGMPAGSSAGGSGDAPAEGDRPPVVAAGGGGHDDPRVEDNDPRVGDNDPRVEDNDPRVEDNDPRVEDNDPRVEDDADAARATDVEADPDDDIVDDLDDLDDLDDFEDLDNDLEELARLIGFARADDVADEPDEIGFRPVTGSLGTVNLDRSPDDLPVALAEARVFAGYAGWGPRQLDAEVMSGDWLVLALQERDVFDADPSGLWSRILRRQGGWLAVLARHPVDPSVN
jgi:putative AlgH/UPF0301 family transcriptional regulator